MIQESQSHSAQSQASAYLRVQVSLWFKKEHKKGHTFQNKTSVFVLTGV